MAKKHVQLETQIKMPVSNNPGNAKVFNKRPLSDEPAAMQMKYYAKQNDKETEVVKATPKGLRALVAGTVKEMGLSAEWHPLNGAIWSGDNISYTQIKERGGYIPSNISADLIKRMMMPLGDFIDKDEKKIELYLHEVEKNEDGKCKKRLSFSVVVNTKMKEGWSKKLKEMGKVLDGTGVTHFGMHSRLMFESDLGSATTAFDIPFFKSCERSEP
jgi:hypothetical protein